MHVKNTVQASHACQEHRATRIVLINLGITSTSKHLKQNLESGLYQAEVHSRFQEGDERVLICQGLRIRDHGE